MTDEEKEQVALRIKFQVEFIAAHGITRYVSEVNGVSDIEAQALIDAGRVNVAYLKGLSNL